MIERLERIDGMSARTDLLTERLLLRPWRAEDAAMLLPILEANREHLSPWIPARVAEPLPVPALAARLQADAEAFAGDRAWRYATLSPADGRLLGELSLFPRSAAGRVPLAEADRAEIGYWLRADETGRGLATEGVRALLEAAMAIERFRQLEIRCDARNGPSIAIPRRLGFHLAETIEVPADLPHEPAVRLQVWLSPCIR